MRRRSATGNWRIFVPVTGWTRRRKLFARNSTRWRPPPMNKFLRQLIMEWRRLELPAEGATFVVAVSGGADSVSLLLAVDELRRRKKLRLEFVVAHFDHALRGKGSDKDESFVRK